MTTTKVNGSVLPITHRKIIKGFCKDHPNINYKDIGKTNAEIVKYFSDQESAGKYDWSHVLNWCLERLLDNNNKVIENRLGNGVQIQFPNGNKSGAFVYKMRNRIIARRGGKHADTSKKSSGSKCIIILNRVNDKETARRPIIEFEGNFRDNYCMEFNRQVRLSGLDIRGGEDHNNLVYVNVMNWDGTDGGGIPPLPNKKNGKSNQTRYDADTDSGINRCKFSHFANKTAVLYRGRNTNVQRCVFEETGGDNTVGVWHFFKDILENKYYPNDKLWKDPPKGYDVTESAVPKPGENRKNLIVFNEFRLNEKAFAIRLGKSPNYINDEYNVGYGNYGSTQVCDNTVYSGRFIKIVGGTARTPKINDRGFPADYTDTKQRVSGLSMLNNRLISERNSNTTTGSTIKISDCILSANITGIFQGGNSAQRAIDIENTTEIDSLLVDAGFENYNSKAIKLPRGSNGCKDNNTIITGYIKGRNSKDNGKNGVDAGNDLNKNNRMVPSAKNREIPNQLRQMPSSTMELPKASDNYNVNNAISLVQVYEALLIAAIHQDFRNRGTSWTHSLPPDPSDPHGEKMDDNENLINAPWYPSNKRSVILDYYEEWNWTEVNNNNKPNGNDKTTMVRKYDFAFDYINARSSNDLKNFGIDIRNNNLRDMDPTYHNPWNIWKENTFDNVISYGKKLYITRPITLNKRFVFTCLNGRNNMIMWTRLINGGKVFDHDNKPTNPNKIGLTLTKPTIFHKCGFSSTGADGSDKNNADPFAKNSGCNLLHFAEGAGRSIVEKCGFAGHRGRVAITWNCSDEGRVIVNDCIFKDCKGGRHIHAYARNKNQRTDRVNYIVDTTFHSGGNSIPLLIGNYDSLVNATVDSNKNFSKFYIGNNLGDIGSQIVGLNIGSNSVENIQIVGFNMTGTVKTKTKDTKALVHLESGKIKQDFTMIDCNITTLFPSDVQDGMDYILIEKNVDLNDLNIVSSVFTMGEVEIREETFTYAIHESHVNDRNSSAATNKRKKMRIYGLFNGYKTKYQGEKALYEFSDVNKENTYERINSNTFKDYKKFVVTGVPVK